MKHRTAEAMYLWTSDLALAAITAWSAISRSGFVSQRYQLNVSIAWVLWDSDGTVTWCWLALESEMEVNRTLVYLHLGVSSPSFWRGWTGYWWLRLPKTPISSSAASFFCFCRWMSDHRRGSLTAWGMSSSQHLPSCVSELLLYRIGPQLTFIDQSQTIDIP